MIYPDLHLRYVFSVLLSAHKAQLGATLFVFSSFMFSGAALPLPELRRVLPAPAFALLTRSSFIRWGVEAATICELQYWAAIYDVSMTLEVLGLQLDNFDTDMLAMFAYGAVWRLLALTTLYWRDGLVQSVARCASSLAHGATPSGSWHQHRPWGQRRRGLKWNRVQHEPVTSSTELVPRSSELDDSTRSAV